MRAKAVERWRTELAGLESLLNERQSTFFVEDKVLVPLQALFYFIPRSAALRPFLTPDASLNTVWCLTNGYFILRIGNSHMRLISIQSCTSRNMDHRLFQTVPTKRSICQHGLNPTNADVGRRPSCIHIPAIFHVGPH
jgi:hypothetical protein